MERAIVTLKTLIDAKLLPPGTVVHCNGERAQVIADGDLKYGDELFATPTAFSRRVTGKTSSGWRAVSVKDDKGDMLPLSSLKARLPPNKEKRDARSARCRDDARGGGEDDSDVIEGTDAEDTRRIGRRLQFDSASKNKDRQKARPLLKRRKIIEEAEDEEEEDEDDDDDEEEDEPSYREDVTPGETGQGFADLVHPLITRRLVPLRERLDREGEETQRAISHVKRELERTNGLVRAQKTSVTLSEVMSTKVRERVVQLEGKLPQVDKLSKNLEERQAKTDSVVQQLSRDMKKLQEEVQQLRKQAPPPPPPPPPPTDGVVKKLQEDVLRLRRDLDKLTTALTTEPLLPRIRDENQYC